MQNNDKYNDKHSEVDFHGAAIVDQHGQEVPITEDMVQTACINLETNIPDTFEESV